MSYESTFEYTGLSEVGRVTRVQSGRDVPGEQTAPDLPPPRDQSPRPLALINWPPPRIEKIPAQGTVSRLLLLVIANFLSAECLRIDLVRLSQIYRVENKCPSAAAVREVDRAGLILGAARLSVNDNWRV